MAKYVKWWSDDGKHWCTGCQMYLEPELFSASRGRYGDLDYLCKLCRRERGQAWYRNSPEVRQRIYARAKKWRRENPEAHARHCRQWNLTRKARMRLTLSSALEDPYSGE